MKIRNFIKNKNLVEIIIFFSIFVFGLIWTFCVPPFQKADENTHYLRAVTLSKAQLTCTMNDGVESFVIPRKYNDFIYKSEATEIAYDYDAKTSIQEILSSDDGLNGMDTINWSQFCVLPAFSYIIFILPLLIGDMFKSLLLGFFLCRLFAFILFFIAIIWSYRKIRNSRLRLIIIFYALTPMVLHQASAIGYDYLPLAVIPMIFALNVSFVLNTNIKKRDLVLFVILMIIFLSAKNGYYFVSLVYFLIPWKKINKNFKKYMLISFLVFCLYVGSVLLYQKVFATTGVSYSDVGPNPSSQLELLKDYNYVLILVKETILKYGHFYISSFIGNFGWLDYSFLPFFYTMYTIFVGFLIYYVSKDKFFKKFLWNSVVTIVMLFLSIGAIFLGFYLLVDEVGSDYIWGVQGRYFLVFFPYIIILCAGLLRKFIRNKYFRIITLSLFLIYILFEMVYGIFCRYYRKEEISNTSNKNQNIFYEYNKINDIVIIG